MRRILVAVDGSDAAAEGVRLAADIALRFGARLTLAHVIPRTSIEPDALGLTTAEAEKERRARGEAILHGALAGLGSSGVEAEPRLLLGSPADALVEAASEPDVDLVVAGSRGQGAVARMLLGSVSARLAHACPKPFLLVRGPAPSGSAPAR